MSDLLGAIIRAIGIGLSIAFVYALVQMRKW